MEKKKLTIKEIGLGKLVIIFLAGIFLIIVSFPDLLSQKEGSKTEEQKAIQATGVREQNADDYAAVLEAKLKMVLKKAEGVGDTDVMITLKSSKERITLKDTPYQQETVNETDSTGGTRISSNVNKGDESVMVSGGSGGTEPYVVKEIEPEIEGVVVIAEGGDQQIVIAEIIDAVQVLFDVPAHKIKVMKMDTR